MWQNMLLCCAIIMVTGCAATRPPSSDCLRMQYAAAIRDAAAPKPGMTAYGLTAITPVNPTLIHRRERWRVLMVKWTDDMVYQSRVGQLMHLPDAVWVTVAPEVQLRCRGYNSLAWTVLRIEQLLGLPPASGYHTFVEMWVEPKDLFRPAADPEIDDQTAQAEFPVAGKRQDAAYRRWFEEWRAVAYGANGYPWTRLGYTYDWGSPDRPVGLSEFVIRANAVVEIHRVTGTAGYCGL